MRSPASCNLDGTEGPSRVLLRGREEGRMRQYSSAYNAKHNAEFTYPSRPRSRVLIGIGRVLLSTVQGEEVAWIIEMKFGWRVEC